jgi:hypothetical protein
LEPFVNNLNEIVRVYNKNWGLQMKLKNVAAIAALGSMLAGCAGQNFAASPVAQADQQIRYTQGVATTLADKPNGSIQLTAVGFNNGRLVFGAAAFNKGSAPANLGMENVTITSGDKPLRVYSRDDLAHEAKVKATWAAVGTALAGAAAAYSANQAAYSHTNGTIVTPRGHLISYQETTYDPAVAAAGTAAAGAATAYGLNSIKNSLDRTISGLNGSILQMNTVYPGQSAGGEIVVDLPKSKTFPQPLEISIQWNGDTYVFDFDVHKAEG